MEALTEFLIDISEKAWIKFKKNAVYILLISVAPFLLFTPYFLIKISLTSPLFIVLRIFLLFLCFIAIYSYFLTIKDIHINKKNFGELFEFKEIARPLGVSAVFLMFLAFLSFLCFIPSLVTKLTPYYGLIQTLPAVSVVLMFFFVPVASFFIFHIMDGRSFTDTFKSMKEILKDSKGELFFISFILALTAGVLNMVVGGMLLAFPLVFLIMAQAYAEITKYDEYVDKADDSAKGFAGKTLEEILETPYASGGAEAGHLSGDDNVSDYLGGFADVLSKFGNRETKSVREQKPSNPSPLRESSTEENAVPKQEKKVFRMYEVEKPFVYSPFSLAVIGSTSIMVIENNREKSLNIIPGITVRNLDHTIMTEKTAQTAEEAQQLPQEPEPGEEAGLSDFLDFSFPDAETLPPDIDDSNFIEIIKDNDPDEQDDLTEDDISVDEEYIIEIENKPGTPKTGSKVKPNSKIIHDASDYLEGYGNVSPRKKTPKNL